MDMQDVNRGLDREMGHWSRRAYLIVSGFCFLYRISNPSTVVLLIFAAAPQSAFDYNPGAKNAQTIITEWDLKESRAWIPGLLQSLYYVGFMPGTVIFGQLSDLFGRRSVAWKAFAASLFIQILSGFCQSWEQFAVCRVFHGVFSGGLSVVDTILMQELSGSKLWPLNGILASVQFSVNMFLYIILAYYVPSWRSLYFASAVPGLLGFIFFFIAPESPRWLVTKGKRREAERSLAWLAKLNREENAYHILRNENEYYDNINKEVARGIDTNSILDLVRSSKLRSRTLIMSLQWFTASLVFYGITLGSGAFSDNFYLANIVSDLSGIPALPFMLYMIKRPWGGRRRTLSVCTSLGAFATFATYLLRFSGENSNYKLAFLLVGKLGISAAFDLAYIFTSEMYPTVVRNVGLGSMSLCARIGGITAPFLINDSVFSDPFVPFLWYGLLCGLCGALALFLPETRGKEPKDRIEDLCDEDD